ncbi:MAG: hypothetical protein ACYCSQ_00570 [bacterium]
MQKAKKNKIKKEVRNKNVSVRVSPELYDEYKEAKEIAENLGLNISLSIILRNGIAEYIEKIRAAEKRIKKNT